MKRGSMADFAAHLRRQAAEASALPFEGARIAAPVMTEGVREQFGHAPPLADLAESTQAKRARLGFTPNDPLVRSGELRESFVPTVAGPLAATGSIDPRARWHEDGSQHYPPRPVNRLGMVETTPLLRRIWKGIVGRVVRG